MEETILCFIESAVLSLSVGHVRKLTHEDEDYKISVYQVGDIVRIDIKSMSKFPPVDANPENS